MSKITAGAAKEIMDIREASAYMGIAEDTMYRYAAEKFLPAFKLGNRWRFRKSALEERMKELEGAK